MTLRSKLGKPLTVTLRHSNKIRGKYYRTRWRYTASTIRLILGVYRKVALLNCKQPARVTLWNVCNNLFFNEMKWKTNISASWTYLIDIWIKNWFCTRFSSIFLFLSHTTVIRNWWYLHFVFLELRDMISKKWLKCIVWMYTKTLNITLYQTITTWENMLPTDV